MPLLFSYGKLSYEEVKTFLLETDKEFPTPLSTHIDIDVYAKKLSEFSDFAICTEQGSIVGMISCYTNRPPLGYISNVCVKKQYQGQKVFSRLFHLLITNVKEKGVNLLSLEVDSDNIKSRRIYVHHGFRELESSQKSNKLPMALQIV